MSDNNLAEHIRELDATTRALSHDPVREAIERGFWERAFCAALKVQIRTTEPFDPDASMDHDERWKEWTVDCCDEAADFATAALAEHRKQPWRVGQ